MDSDSEGIHVSDAEDALSFHHSWQGWRQKPKPSQEDMLKRSADSGFLSGCSFFDSSR